MLAERRLHAGQSHAGDERQLRVAGVPHHRAQARRRLVELAGLDSQDVGALTGDNIARRDRWEQRYEPVAREVTSCRTVRDVQSRVVGYRVDYEYRGQRFSTLMQDQPGAFVPVRVSVEAVGR